MFERNLHRNVQLASNMFAFGSFLHNHKRPNTLTIHPIASTLTGHIRTVYMSEFQSIFQDNSDRPDTHVIEFVVLGHMRHCRMTSYPSWTNEKLALASKILRPRMSNDSMVPT